MAPRKAASPSVSEFGRRHAIICGGKKRGLGEARSRRRRERVEGGRICRPRRCKFGMSLVERGRDMQGCSREMNPHAVIVLWTIHRTRPQDALIHPLSPHPHSPLQSFSSLWDGLLLDQHFLPFQSGRHLRMVPDPFTLPPLSPITLWGGARRVRTFIPVLLSFPFLLG